MKRKTGLTLPELLSLDTLIAVAQQRGLSLKDRVEKTQEQAEAMGDIHQAMMEARHGGLEVNEKDKKILAKIRELASQLEIAPTLNQLVELRGEALRQQYKRRS